MNNFEELFAAVLANLQEKFPILRVAPDLVEKCKSAVAAEYKPTGTTSMDVVSLLLLVEQHIPTSKEAENRALCDFFGVAVYPADELPGGEQDVGKFAVTVLDGDYEGDGPLPLADSEEEAQAMAVKHLKLLERSKYVYGERPLGGFDHTAAVVEGWDLFDVDGRLMLQRNDEPAEEGSATVFASDADALIFVALKANHGSAYHRQALELIGSGAD